MSTDVIIDVAGEFSRYPAGRYRSDGRYSGERFRQDFLVPALKKVKEQGIVTIEMDGAAGYGPSFLEEAFGGLVRKEGFTRDFLRRRLRIRTSRTNREKLIWEDIATATDDTGVA